MDAIHILVLVLGGLRLISGFARSEAEEVPNLPAYRAGSIPTIILGVALIVLALVL